MQGQHGDTTAFMWYCWGIVCTLKHTPLLESGARGCREYMNMDSITFYNNSCQAADDSVICSLGYI